MKAPNWQANMWRKNFEKGTKTAILKGIEGQTNAADRYNGFIEGAGDTGNCCG